MLGDQDAVGVIIDVQGKLAQSMHERDALFDNLQRLVRGLKLLGIPLLWTEQYPQGLGPTIPELAALLQPSAAISKVSFSCSGCPAFRDALRALGRRQVLLAGIEAHVCVFQTARDLAAEGFEVHVVADAVSSRRAENARLGIERMRAAGAQMTGVESALFELMKTAEHPRFREMLQVVR